MKRLIPLPLVAFVLPCLPGCQDGKPGDSGLTARDSVGIQIVESSAPLLGPGAWTISEEPVLQIGEGEGDERYMFPDIPFYRERGTGGVFQLDDGRIVVAEDNENAIRFFDQTGAFLSQFGRRGEGLADFRIGPRACVAHGDGIAIVDGMERVSFFNAEGEFLDRTEIHLSVWTNIHGIFPDGSILTQARDLKDETRWTPGVHTESAIVSIFRPDGQPGTWTLTMNGRRTVLTTWRDSPTVLDQPFGPQLILLTLGEEFVYGWADSYDLQVFDRGGMLKRIIRRDWDLVPVTEEDREWFTSSLFEFAGGGEDARTLVEGLIFPDHQPVFDRILSDALGHLWVRRFDARSVWEARGGGGTYPMDWDLFDPSGRWITTLTLPAHFAVHSIGADHIIGVWTDEDYVQYVRKYALDRGG